MNIFWTLRRNSNTVKNYWCCYFFFFEEWNFNEKYIDESIMGPYKIFFGKENQRNFSFEISKEIFGKNIYKKKFLQFKLKENIWEFFNLRQKSQNKFSEKIQKGLFKIHFMHKKGSGKKFFFLSPKKERNEIFFHQKIFLRITACSK